MLTSIRVAGLLASLVLTLPLGAQAVSRDSTRSEGLLFLARPYTLRDHAIEAMHREASEWAQLFDGSSNFSSELILPSTGLAARGSAGSSNPPGISVTVSFVVHQIVGDRRQACEKHLRSFARTFHGIAAKDAYGEETRIKLMRWRMGPAGNTNSPQVKAAALELLNQTTLNQTIFELSNGSMVECTLDSSNVVSFSQ